MSHLLDTNSWVDYLRRGSASNITTRLLAAQPGTIHLCSIVLAELYYGAKHSGPIHSANNLALVETIRQQYPSLPFVDRAAETYGTIREHLAAQGLPIGPNDLMIAAIAIANDLIVVTRNVS